MNLLLSARLPCTKVLKDQIKNLFGVSKNTSHLCVPKRGNTGD